MRSAVLAILILSASAARGQKDVETAYQRFDRSVESYIAVQESLLELERELDEAGGSGKRKDSAARIARLRAQLRSAERRTLNTAGEYLEGRRASSGGIRDIGALRMELLQDGERLLLMRDFKNALFSVDKAIGLRREDPAGHLLKARILMEMGLHRSALDSAQRALKLDAGNAEARKIIAFAQLKSGKVKQAVDAIAKVFTGKSLFGTDGEAWSLPEEQSREAAPSGDSTLLYVGGAATAALAGFLISGFLWRRRKKAAPAPETRPAAPSALDNSGEEYLAGKYELLDIRDYGKASQVWLAKDHSLRRPVIVQKVLLAALSSPEKVKTAFVGNARAVATLRHPNVVDIYEIVEEADSFFLVHEALGGKSLKRRVETDGVLSPEETAAVFREVCSALSAAHARGLLHRSLCPEHIQLTGSGHVKVLDFGGSRILGEFTQNAYLPPEAEFENPTTAYDVYSLGATAYFALSGKEPVGVLAVERFPEGLGRLLERTLEADRTKRLQTVKEFESELDGVAGGRL